MLRFFLLSLHLLDHTTTNSTKPESKHHHLPNTIQTKQTKTPAHPGVMATPMHHSFGTRTPAHPSMLGGDDGGYGGAYDAPTPGGYGGYGGGYGAAPTPGGAGAGYEGSGYGGGAAPTPGAGLAAPTPGGGGGYYAAPTPGYGPATGGPGLAAPTPGPLGGDGGAPGALGGVGGDGGALGGADDGPDYAGVLVRLPGGGEAVGRRWLPGGGLEAEPVGGGAPVLLDTVELVRPSRQDLVKVVGGPSRGATGRLISVEGGDAVLEGGVIAEASYVGRLAAGGGGGGGGGGADGAAAAAAGGG